MKFASSQRNTLTLGAGTLSLTVLLLSMQGTVTPSHIDCVRSVRDASDPMICLPASSAPQLGHLYPLSADFNIDMQGQVGMGTTTSSSGLTVLSQVTGADGVHAIGGANPTGTAGDGLVATGGTGATGGGGSEGGAGVIGRGGVGAPAGAGVIGIGAFAPPFGGTGIFGFGANSDTGPGRGIVGVGGRGDAGTDGVTGIHGYGGDADFSGGMFPSVGGAGLVGTPGIGEVAGAAVVALGDFIATGIKSFANPHPTNPAQEIRFVCLEGNESGTYFRGSARSVDGRAVIDVPEEFRLVTNHEGMTVQLTAVGARADLWIEARGLDQIVVRSDADVEFDYFVNGVRRGFEEYEAITTNRSFVPEMAGEAFGAQYPDAVRQMLVDNGTLKPNFEPNEQTASRLGWTLKHPEDSSIWETKTSGRR
jgi:hypothetical protein